MRDPFTAASARVEIDERIKVLRSKADRARQDAICHRQDADDCGASADHYDTLADEYEQLSVGAS